MAKGLARDPGPSTGALTARGAQPTPPREKARQGRLGRSPRPPRMGLPPSRLLSPQPLPCGNPNPSGAPPATGIHSCAPLAAPDGEGSLPGPGSR